LTILFVHLIQAVPELWSLEFAIKSMYVSSETCLASLTHEHEDRFTLSLISLDFSLRGSVGLRVGLRAGQAGQAPCISLREKRGTVKRPGQAESSAACSLCFVLLSVFVEMPHLLAA